MFGIRRREFITLLGGAAASWPLAARAQQRERMRRIGVLMNLAADDAEGQARLAGFLQGLQEAGWAVGRNAQIDIRWGGGDVGQMRKQVTEMAALAPDVILASSPEVVVPRRDPHHPDRIRGGIRSRRLRIRRKPGPAGRELHRFHLG
jgi:putative tryptophan/tyrosine transport system substrate-binding protein